MKYINLTNSTERGIISDGDIALQAYSWYLSRHGYICRSRQPCIWLHRSILTPPAGLFIDHINQDKLDNRRENLRICSKSQNMANCVKRKNNTTGYKGVFDNNGSYTVRVGHKYIATVTDIKLAALLYNIHAKRIYGEFAFCNLI